ncbi:hypothetical protein NM208_g10502 [Fusarium decemcellulare]|uniref:Uncharacterized protein n=1 Tax=Fusarium decemcellulare TaxID=57161 RepID=A0ACC1RXV3_9HYPO|nr:hypothetical protein NM208_g10502 [Fusarium decemcellulare]
MMDNILPFLTMLHETTDETNLSEKDVFFFRKSKLLEKTEKNSFGTVEVTILYGVFLGRGTDCDRASMATPWTRISIDEVIYEREHNGVCARECAYKEDSAVAVKGLLVGKGSVGVEQGASGKLLNNVTENDKGSAKKGQLLDRNMDWGHYKLARPRAGGTRRRGAEQEVNYLSHFFRVDFSKATTVTMPATSPQTPLMRNLVRDLWVDALSVITLGQPLQGLVVEERGDDDEEGSGYARERELPLPDAHVEG